MFGKSAKMNLNSFLARILTQQINYFPRTKQAQTNPQISQNQQEILPTKITLDSLARTVKIKLRQLM